MYVCIKTGVSLRLTVMYIQEAFPMEWTSLNTSFLDPREITILIFVG